MATLRALACLAGALLSCGGHNVIHVPYDAGPTERLETDGGAASGVDGGDVGPDADIWWSDDGPIVWNRAQGFVGTPVHARFGVGPSPRALYVATAADGLQASVDRGTTWGNLNGALPNLHLYAIDVAPNNPRSLWAVADRAYGTPHVFHTSDLGLTWSRMHLSNPSGREYDVATMHIQPSSGQYFGGRDPVGNHTVVLTGFAAGDYWTPHPIANATGTVRQIAQLTSNRTYVAVSGDNGRTGGIYRSFNSGNDWELAVNGIDPARVNRASAVAIDPNDAQTVYAGFDAGGLVYKTVDGGNSWALANVNLDPDAAVLGFVVREGNSNEVYVATSSGVFRSRDGGALWRPYGLEGARVVTLAIDRSVTSGRPLLAAGVTSPEPGVWLSGP